MGELSALPFVDLALIKHRRDDPVEVSHVFLCGGQSIVVQRERLQRRTASERLERPRQLIADQPELLQGRAALQRIKPAR